jgi:hypothetical protein
MTSTHQNITAKHCNQDYLITIDSVKIEIVNQFTGQEMKEKTKEENKNKQQEQQEHEPKAITMAEELQTKAKLGDGSNFAAEDR